MPANAARTTDGAPLQPFLKWAGGKRWLAPRLIDELRSEGRRYIEPFLGGGAIFFATAPQRAVLSDANPELIATYGALQADSSRVENLLHEHHRRHCSAYYYEMRRYAPRCEFRKAARFIYLNRTCWNGLYRVNLKGQFNVPLGTKTSVVMDDDDWDGVQALLHNAKLACCDFEETIDRAGEGDIVFADPPYTVKHNLNGFVKYNQSLFSWADQLRLHDALTRAARRGATVVATNANHESIQELYQPHFQLERIERASILAASPRFRGRFEELLIRGGPRG